jgi:RNase P subunit RPR2
MYDIKDIVPAEEMGNWWKYVGNSSTCWDTVLIYWFIKRQEKNYKKKFLKLLLKSNNITRHLRAKRTLAKKGEVKAYYSELTDIARNYIEEGIEIPAMKHNIRVDSGIKSGFCQKKMTLSQEIIKPERVF